MEHNQIKNLQETNEQGERKEVAESDIIKLDVKDIAKQKPVISSETIVNITDPAASADVNSKGEVNMEAAITSDDVMRAGGFGARDDIGSFLPVASDATDFEASLLDARDYEEPQGNISRPGLGWSELHVAY